tara:strand:- start:1208 stop:1888 length:681 start_codon:yes stop_codon:yes gene_type:complete
MSHKILAYQVYYQPKQKKNLQAGFVSYFNKKATINQENEIIEHLISRPSAAQAEWFGVFSQAVRRKLNNFTFERLREACQKHPEADILAPNPQNYSFCDYIRKPHPLRYTLEKKQYETFVALLPKLGISPKILRPSHVIYCNYFVAKPAIYKDYVDSILSPAMELFRTDSELQELGMRRSHYNYKTPPANYTKDTGLKYYPHIPFILERLINVYIQLNQPKTKWVL